MTDTFEGIGEKLKRADENILNLKAEIDTFIQNGKYPILPRPNDELWQDAVDYHRNRIMPPRFSVLAGEVVHHLRSILDHLVWEFSDESERRQPASKRYEFPVFETRPPDKDTIALYERKIKGVTKSEIRKLIDDLQPYQPGPQGTISDPKNNPIWIIHELDIIDKHRELAIFIPEPNIVFTVPRTAPEHDIIVTQLMLYKERERDGSPIPAATRAAVSHALKHYAEVTPQVSFKQFGRREGQSVVPGLQYLSGFVADMVNRFRKYL